MDNHKLVMISIFFAFYKHDKDAICFVFYENMIGKLLDFDRMQENKTFFFCFLRGN